MVPDILPPLPDLPREVGRMIAQVPSGRVTTYGDLAKGLGHVMASRWIGSLLLRDPQSAAWPSHRVVRVDGSLGMYAHGGIEKKTARLREEGVAVHEGKVDLGVYGVREFKSSRPLKHLRRLQDELPQQCLLHFDGRPPKTIAGLDVSYGEGHLGVGGYALVDVESGGLLWSTTVRCEVHFPYISSYLAYRELPVLAELYAAAEEADRLADVFMIDGAGIMHPRRAGIATHFGILADAPTIGITKKLLAGQFDDKGARAREPRDVCDGGELLGVAIRPRESSQRFLWVSPGHRMDVGAASAITLPMLRGRRLPEPIYWADRLSRRACG